MSVQEDQLRSNAPTLHHLDNSQSQRVLWLLCELELAYPSSSEHPFAFNVVHHFRSEGRPPNNKLAKVHPLGRSPVLVTTDGRVLHESVTITTYLIKTYDLEGHFQPSPAEEKAGFDWIRDNALCSLAASSLGGVYMVRLLPEMVAQYSPFVISWIFSLSNKIITKFYTQSETESFLKYLQDDMLKDNNYFMGSKPGGADFTLSWPMDMIVERGWVNLDERKWSGLKEWYARIKKREGWKMSLEKGNGYSLLFKEVKR